MRDREGKVEKERRRERGETEKKEGERKRKREKAGKKEVSCTGDRKKIEMNLLCLTVTCFHLTEIQGKTNYSVTIFFIIFHLEKP